MAEQLNLTTPIVPPTITNYRVVLLELNWKSAFIGIGMEGPNGETFRYSYSGVTATNLMIALNKANLSTTSLQKRILNQLLADGVVVGTVSGTPD